MGTSLEARGKLVSALELDLVGPPAGHVHEAEVIDQAPSRWYLTGFLVPRETKPEDKVGHEGDGEVDSATGSGSGDDEHTPERASARKALFPSSMGLSVLVPASAKSLSVTVQWGDYAPTEARAGRDGAQRSDWKRTQRQVSRELPLSKRGSWPVPGFEGLRLVSVIRKVHVDDGIALPKGTRAVSLFFVNEREPLPEQNRDEAYVFQARIAARCDQGFVARPNWRGLMSSDPDERIADLQYRDAAELAVGHGVSTHAVFDGDTCHEVHTTWLPCAGVERVIAAEVPGVELRMGELGRLESGAEAKQKLGAFITEWERWLEEQRGTGVAHERRKEVADSLLHSTELARKRLADGIGLLSRPEVLRAFCLANEAMDSQARQRDSVKQPPVASEPAWRPFQLAFVLMNLRGVVEPSHPERELVDLLFFPTGGGKTEAYLGLAAFTLLFRRLANPGLASAGLSVLMRYTLRLLTLDQLQRASALVCALELLRGREKDLGPWPFEIGLWVGKAATPNKMGKVGDNDKESARARTIAFINNDKKPSPIPLESCPWCGERFRPASFKLMKDGVANDREPADLRILCLNRKCAFAGRPLPVLAVDEPIYRRLPCFLVATLDKFAGLPWEGRAGALFGKVSRFDGEGFYGPCDADRGQPLQRALLPPDLIIQDELHLISGPLGTMAGLYESAIERLCQRELKGQVVKPKIVASTATVRRAESQIRALFARAAVEVFPPPGPDRRDSFFAKTVEASQKDPARLYLGVASTGRSLKVILLRTYVALLSAAQKLYEAEGGKRTKDNAADPYMTLLGYFNSLRELGGARRIVEDEVQAKVARYNDRHRVGEEESQSPFARRRIQYDVVELTSRESSSSVAKAKRRLEVPMTDSDCVDVAIATNMISVGLDITRLGLMVVLGQPKTTAEYIQASSRVGRSPAKPGLVVTLLNVHRPRDRSHYERFEAYHQTFYRSVEASSVTPFSSRAIDRGLAGVVVGLARHGQPELTAPRNAIAMDVLRAKAEWVCEALAARAMAACPAGGKALGDRVRQRAGSLLDDWSVIAAEQRKVQAGLQYQRETGHEPPLLRTPLDPELDKKSERERRFKANRSLRDVEPSVNLYVKSLVNQYLVDDEEVE